MRPYAELVNKVKRHYEFGKNWLEYSKLIDAARLDYVCSDLARLLNTNNLNGKRVLDIGCGSGVHEIGFYMLGCRNLTAIDYDNDSVIATKQNLKRYCPESNFIVLKGDILKCEDLMPLGRFDIVYSWGVLHHTGNLEEAIRNTSLLVSNNGHLAIALYRKTFMCGLWKIEKRIYSKLPKLFQLLVEFIYIFFFALALLITKRVSIFQYIHNYSSKRGMSFITDVRDWLGGYPYESISPDDLRKIMSSLGFSQIHSQERKKSIGIFGSGCDEFLFQKD